MNLETFVLNSSKLKVGFLHKLSENVSSLKAVSNGVIGLQDLDS